MKAHESLTPLSPLELLNSCVILPPEATEYLRAYERNEADRISAQRYGSERQMGSKIQGRGLFATHDLPRNTVTAIKPGRIVDTATIIRNSAVIQHSHQQIDDDRFLTGLTPEEVEANLVGYNHSCDPNAKVVVLKDIPLAFVVARRKIKAGEEITVDYGASQVSDTHQIFGCLCGSKNCRLAISPHCDWIQPKVQTEYEDEFPFFIQNKIDWLKKLPQAERDMELLRYGLTQSAEMVAFLQSLIVKNEKRLEVLGKYDALRPGLFRLLVGAWLSRKGIIPPKEDDIRELKKFHRQLRRVKLKYLQLFVGCSPFNQGDERLNRRLAIRQEDLITRFALRWDEKINEPYRDRVLSLPIF